MFEKERGLVKKRLLSALLALALCLSLTVPAMAAGQTFTDVTSGL